MDYNIGMRSLLVLCVLFLAGCPATSSARRAAPSPPASLTSTDWRARVRAVRSLAAEQGTPATDRLLSAAADPRPEVRMAVLDGLAGRKALAARQAVLDALKDPQLPVRVAALYALTHWPDLEVDTRLRKILVRQAAGLADEASTALVARLSQGAPAMRRARLVALLGLADLLPTGRRKTLLSRLARIRRQVSALLVDLGTDPKQPERVNSRAQELLSPLTVADLKRLAAHLSQAVKSRTPAHKRLAAVTDWLRQGARNLGTRAVPVLVRMAQSGGPKVQDRVDRVLCELGKVSPDAALVRGARSESAATRAVCVYALRYHTVPGAVPALFAALAREPVQNTPVPYLVWAPYFQALLRAKPSVTALRRALERPEILVRVVALRLTERLKRPLSREAWVAAKDLSRDVRLAAAVALGGTGGGTARLTRWVARGRPAIRVEAMLSLAQQGRAPAVTRILRTGSLTERAAAYLALASARSAVAKRMAKRDATRGPAALRPFAKRYLDALSGKGRLPRDLRTWASRELVRQMIGCIPAVAQANLRRGAAQQAAEFRLASAHRLVGCLLQTRCTARMECLSHLDRVEGRFVQWRDRDAKRKRREGTYKDGVPDGAWVEYHANGRVAVRGSYRAGRRWGRWVWLNERSRIVRTCLYRAKGAPQCRGTVNSPPRPASRRP